MKYAMQGAVVMEFKKFGNQYILRLDKGEEIVGTLQKFCEKERIKAGFIQGIGAVNKAVVGAFNTGTKEFRPTELSGIYEITSLLGNVSEMDGEVYLHLHINLADEKCRTFGGHLKSAVISATGELAIETVEGEAGRKYSEEIGLNLYRF